MSKYIIDGVQMTSLADAVRSATGTSDPLSFGEIVSTVGTMGTGTDYLASTCNKTITELVNSEITTIAVPNMFQNCLSLSLVSLPNCSSIAYSVFSQCNNLKEVYLDNCLNFNMYNFYSPLLSILYMPKLSSIGSAYNLLTNSYLSFTVSDLCFVGSVTGNYIEGTSSCYTTPSLKLMGLDIIGAGYGSRYSVSENTWWNSTTSTIEFPSTAGYIQSNLFTSWTNQQSGIYGISGENIRTIGSTAFSSTSNLTTINCPNLIGIGYNAFGFGNNTISSLVCGDLKYIGSFGLNRLYRFNSSLLRDLTRCEYFGDYALASGTFNATINLEKATYIGTQAFQYCSQLNFVGDMHNVSVIGAYAFITCKGLKSVDAPLVSIANSSIFNTTGISFISMANLTTIGSYMCNGCTSLKSLYFEKATIIYINAFDNCPNIETIYMPKYSALNSTVFKSASSTITSVVLNWEQYYGTGYALYNNFKNMVWTDGDGYRWFSLPSNSKYAYCGRENNNVISYVSIDASYFDNDNGSVQEFNLPNVSYLSMYMFTRNQLRKITAENCRKIDNGTFAYQSMLNSINFPNCTSIGNHAFQEVYQLGGTPLEMSEVLYIGQSAFYSDYMLQGISFPKVSYVGNSAFCSCRGLTNAYLGSVYYLGVSAFAECSYLSEATIKFSNNSTQLTGQVSIPQYAFSNCFRLSSLTLDIESVNNFTQIGDYAFANCRSLSKLSFQFKNTNTTANFYIRSYVTYQCSILSKVMISYLVSNSTNYLTIYSNAFNTTSQLMSIYLINNSSIGSMVYLANSNAFNNTPITNSTYTGNYGSIYVQASYLDSYKTSTNWSWFTDRLVGLTDEEIQNVIANW